jgi:enterochelin esterase-like enzyme
MDGAWAALPIAAASIIASADAVSAQRRTRPLLLVFTPETLSFDNGSAWTCAREAMYTPWPARYSLTCPGVRGQSDAYLSMVADVLLPAVRTRFGLQPSEKAAIAGYSLGGLTACYAAYARRDAFDAAACNSPSFWYPVENFHGPDDFRRTDFATLLATAPPPFQTRLYVSDGTAEFLSMGGTRRQPGSIPMMVDAMRSTGLRVAFEQNGGLEHDEERSWLTSVLWRGLAAVVAPTV